MKYLWYGYITAFAAGFAIQLARMWYFQLQMVNNKAPGISLWRGSMFDSSLYNEKGQIFQRKMRRAWAIAVVYGLGGMLLMAKIDSIVR